MKVLFGVIGLLIGIFALGQIWGGFCAKLSVYRKVDDGELDKKSIEVRMAKQLTWTILIWGIILLGLVAIVCTVFKDYRNAFLTGVAISLLLSFLSSGSYVREFYKNVDRELDRIARKINDSGTLL